MNDNPAGSFGASFPQSEIPPAQLDRRRENRRPVQSRASLTVLDGPSTNTTYDVLTRDLSLSGISFLLRVPLSIGDHCRMDLQTPSGVTSHTCEVIRAREISNGRFEIAVQFRGKP